MPELAFEITRRKWASKSIDSHSCGFCDFDRHFGRNNCDSCPAYIHFDSSCFGIISDLEPNEVLDLLDEHKDDLIAAGHKIIEGTRGG